MKGGEYSPPNSLLQRVVQARIGSFNEGRGIFPAKPQCLSVNYVSYSTFNEGRGIFPAKQLSKTTGPDQRL